MNPYVPLPHDLVFFLQGFISLLVAVFLFWSLNRFRSREQGQYLIGFLALSALHSWMHMVMLGWVHGPVTLWLLVVTQCASFAGLAMAGYRAFVPSTAPSSVRWLPVFFYVFLLAGQALGAKTNFLLSHLLGGSVALLLGTAGLLKDEVLSGGLERSLTEMGNDELLDLVSLDLSRAVEA